MHRACHAMLVALIMLPLVACDTPPASARDATAWRAALQECRRIARVEYGYASSRDFGGIGRPTRFVHDTSWEVVDPCMVARGFAPPP